MKHPEKWRETENPYELPYKNFRLTEILGYPHAGNDVFHAKGIYQHKEVEVYVKVARQLGADIKNEIDTINTLNWNLAPQVIDFDEKRTFCSYTGKNRGAIILYYRGQCISLIIWLYV